MKVNKWEVIKDENIKGYTLHQIRTIDEGIDIIFTGDKVSQDEDKDYFYLKYDNYIIARISKKQRKFSLVREDLQKREEKESE